MAPSRIATSVFTARPGEDGIWTVKMVVSVLPTLSASSRFRNAPSSVCADFTDIPSLCASFSAAVSDTLVPRMVMAMEQTGYHKVAVAGGVAANSRIRRDILAAAQQLGARVYMPPLSLCGDNGAMIGAQAYYEYLAGNTADMSLNAYATKSILGEAL